jgi:hypothetical protein
MLARFPVGVTTAIGSLPHEDAGEAARFSLEHHPLLPPAPSLPRRSPFEGMVAQAAWGIPGVLVLDDGSLLVEEASVDPALGLIDPGIDGEPFVALRAFLAALDGWAGPFKLQLTGPVTLGLALHAVGVAPERAFAVAAQAVDARIDATLQAAVLAAPAGTPVLFLDEPGLCAVLQPGFPLDLGATLDLVSSAMARVQRRAVAGLHCCGRADWHAVLQTGPQVLSLPVGTGITDHAGSLADFLEAGGWVAWGAVPTDGPFSDSVELLWRRLRTEWGQLVAGGCDPVLLRERALITPGCGLVGLDTYQAEVVVRLTAEIGERVSASAGTSLYLGA